MKNPERRKPFSNGWTQEITELEKKVETLEREKAELVATLKETIKKFEGGKTE